MKFIITLFAISLISTTAISQNPASCNCCSDKHAEFDFWIGTWNVTNPDGTPAGRNVIKKIQNNCILQENWTSASPGFTGTSNNFYNYKAQQWEQIWVDNQGQSLHLKGHRKGNQMIMRTDDETNKEGLTFYHRVTWSKNDDGTVRQLWETITEGKETSIAFDGLYKKEE